MRDIKYYLPGILLILMAVAIIAMPEILVALVAAMVILAGIVALRIGHLMKTSHVTVEPKRDLFFDDEFFNWPFAARSVYSRWRRRL